MKKKIIEQIISKLLNEPDKWTFKTYTPISLILCGLPVFSSKFRFIASSKSSGSVPCAFRAPSPMEHAISPERGVIDSSAWCAMMDG